MMMMMMMMMSDDDGDDDDDAHVLLPLPLPSLSRRHTCVRACVHMMHACIYQGIIPRVIKKLFWALKTDSTVESSVTMCILEIYCDNIRDLGKAATRMESDAENDEGGGGGTTQQQSTSEW